MANALELAYLAGLFDGEGSIVITSRERNAGLHLTISVVNTAPVVIDDFRLTFGSGAVSTRSRRGSLGKRPLFVIQWSGRAAAEVLRALCPYLKIKRAHADIALKFQATFTRQHCGRGVPSAVQSDREAMRQKLRLVKRA